MKNSRFWGCVLTFLVLCLSACGSAAGPEEAEAFRDFFLQKDTVSMVAVVSADYEDRVYDFTLSYDYVREGKSVIEIIDPEPVRGIRATIEAGQTELDYGDMILDTGPLPGTGLSPIDALPVMLNTWMQGYIHTMGTDKADDRTLHHFSYKSTVAEVEIEHHVWVDRDTLIPVRAEMLADGDMVLSVTFSSMTFTP